MQKPELHTHRDHDVYKCFMYKWRIDLGFCLFCRLCIVEFQLQIASTESFLLVLGHGSPPKTLGTTDTEQDCFPMQF